MSTYNSPVDAVAATLIRSSTINDLDSATGIAFALIPDETLMKQGKVMYAVDTGTANTYLAALPVSPVGYVDGLALTFKAVNANTGACTINVNTLGVVAIAREDGTALVSGDIAAGQMCTIRYSTTSSKFQLEGTNASASAAAAAASASAASTSAATATTQAALATTNGATQVALATTQANDAATSASTATTQATNASNSATTAANYLTVGTSTSSVTIGTGAKSFTATTGKAWGSGQLLSLSSAANTSNYMHGTVTSYNSSTGALVMNILAIGGSGTLADWGIALSGAQGPIGATGPSSTGAGGAAITGNTTLTVSSAAAMTMTPTTQGTYVTLPDATTCLKGVIEFSINNATDFDIGIKNSAGTKLGWIRGYGTCVIGLTGNATAAGIWSLIGAEKLGITALYSSASIVPVASRNIKRVDVDSTRTFFCFCDTTAIYGIMHDSSTNTWGSPTTLRTVAALQCQAILSATNQILLVSFASSTAMETVTLTLSGNAINPNAAVATVLAGVAAEMGQLILVGTSWVISYGRATTTSALRAITISGTVPTVGAEVVVASVSGTQSPVIHASGSIVRSFHATTILLTVTPYTVSGSTLTVGTLATAVTTDASIRVVIAGNGNAIVVFSNTTTRAAVVKLTGTVEAISEAVLGTSVGNIASYSDYMPITSTKMAYLYGNYINIITDTAGTISVGTELLLSSLYAGTIGAFTGIYGNTVRVGKYISSSLSTYVNHSVDCSGASPTSSSVASVYTLQNFGTGLISSNNFGARYNLNIYNNGNCYGLNSGNVTAYAPNSVTVSSVTRVNAYIGSSFQPDGTLRSDSWVIGSQPTIVFQHVESAA